MKDINCGQSEVLKLLLNGYTVKLNDGVKYKIIFLNGKYKIYINITDDVLCLPNITISEFLEISKISKKLSKKLSGMNNKWVGNKLVPGGDKRFHNTVLDLELFLERDQEMIFLDELNQEIVCQMTDEYYIQNIENGKIYDYPLDYFIFICDNFGI